MKISYKVPHHSQEGNNTCGLATARMILEYFGYKMTEDEFLKETYMHKYGSWYSDLCKPFLRRGLKTRVYTINTNIYSPFWAGKSEKELRKLLLERKKKLKGLLKTEIEKLIEYLDLGGELEVAIPDPKMLVNTLKSQPIFIPVARSFINPNAIDDLGHYIVLNGFDGKQYSVLDPRGRKYKVDRKILEYAWLANNRDSDGYLMKVLN